MYLRSVWNGLKLFCTNYFLNYSLSEIRNSFITRNIIFLSLINSAIIFVTLEPGIGKYIFIIYSGFDPNLNKNHLFSTPYWNELF